MTYYKDPSAVLDYEVDWTAWLAASETITSHTVTAPAGITVDSSSLAGAVVTVWLSGGTVWERYDVVCHIVTNQGREDDRTLRVAVQDH